MASPSNYLLIILTSIIMAYNKIGDWAIGYLEALSTGNSVSKPQLEKLISRMQEMIQEVEVKQTAINTVAIVEDSEDF